MLLHKPHSKSGNESKKGLHRINRYRPEILQSIILTQLLFDRLLLFGQIQPNVVNKYNTFTTGCAGPLEANSKSRDIAQVDA